MKKLLIIFFLLLSVAGFTQTVTPVLYPRYMEGVGNGNIADLRSVPYACRMTLDGLIPNRLYYYYNRFVLDPSNANPDPNGQGTIIIPQSGATPFQRITGPNLSAASTAGTFTTDANGSYTGWFITEPSASSIYFPGNQLYWRIMLRNDQFAPANAVELRLTAPVTVTTLQWLGYAPPPGTPPAGFVGTLVTRAATATDFTPKNFVMLYDNVAGTGRPIGGTFVEDDLLSVTGLGYIAAYPNGTGAAQNGRWGAIIPSGTPQGPGLASGIRNISQFSFAGGSLVNVCNGNSLGVFGTINTVNHAGTQPTGAGVLNITTCGTTVVNCNNLSLSTVITGTACNASTGAIDLTVAGGTAPYTYLWSNGATTQDISGVPGGNYTVTVTDATNVCTSVAAATVSTTQLISLSAVITGASACVNNSGAIDLTVNGGVGPYTYAWSNSATTEDLTGLTPGSYTVTVTGAGTCTATATYIVLQPAALTATSSAPAIPNCGTTTTVLVSATGGTAPYTGTGSFNVTAGTYSYTVTDARGCTATTSITVAPATCINAAEVIYPKYIQGVGSGSPSSDLKVPYATRMTLTGLNANSTYRFFTSFTDNPASNNNGAAGAMILANQTGDFTRITSTSVGTPGEYGEFTTDGSGSYTGWYVLEPGSDIVFTPGNLLYWRINLNDGSGGNIVTTRVTAPNSVTVINWGFTSGAPLEGSAIYNVANAAWTAKNFVMLYDNIAGTGRPVTGTFIENDGTANTSAEGYDLWYEFFVNGFENVWGTIIPNNLANGINNISQYALSDGSFVNKCTSPDGVYGTTDTRNASTGNDAFGTLLIIDCTPTAGCSLAGTTAVTNVLCFGASTGAVDLTVTGATAPTFLWSNGATTEDLTNVPAGTYTVTITDGSCTATASATVTQPLTPLDASATATNATCGVSNGSVNLTVTGGTFPYSYLWSNGATTEDISSLAAGTYSVTVTDANGCTATASATVNNIAGPGATAVATNATCGNANGAVNLTVTGGTSPYSYLWSNGATSEDISGLVAGTYSVNVTDANGCTATASATVNNIGGPSATAAATNATCGNANGSVNLTVTGGTSPYSYLWSNGATTEDISGLVAGTYSVTVTDANGCTATASATVNNIGGPSATAVATNATCGNANGSVNLTVTGGTAPYSYLWSNGATTEDISGLVAGTYSVTVTDANGCTATASATVNNVAGPSASAVATNATCSEENANGSVNLTVTGGTSPYSYLWSNGATTEDISNVVAGTYSVTVTDANGCTATASATVNIIAGPSATAVATNATCGNANGSVNLTVTGGTAPYSYLWSNGATTEDISGLVAGTYSVNVTDANGCTATASATVNNIGGPSATAAATNATCGNANGSVNLTVTGGTSPYSYLWSNGATTEDISGLVAGTYSVTVTDANGCTATASATVNNIGGPSATAVATNATCGNANGSVNLTVTGGTAPYSYLWSNGATTEDISGLVAGTYSVTVTDANGCTATASATVNNVAGPSASAVATNATCSEENANGSVNLTVTGGTSPYSYLWSNGATTEDISNVVAGTYSVTVTDANGCTATASATVNIIAGPSATAVATNATCGNANGSVNLTVTGGTAPYSYLWSNGATTEDISGLVAGTYSVTVTDANGCTTTASATVNNVGGPSVSITSTTNVLCFGQSTGSINITVSGGVAPYSYLWSNGATTEDISGLAAGTYSVTVTDANSCATTASATITQPAAALSASAVATSATCGNANGSVNLTVTGGTAPYSYLWSNGATTEDISGLVAGTYSVTVTDANGCTATASATVNNIAGLSATAVATASTCGNANGSVNLTVTGGTSPYSYLWSNGATIEDISGLTAGTYSVTVTDANGCTATASATVNNIAGPSATAVATNATCGNANGSVNLTVTGGTAPYTYLWSNGATTEDISGLVAGTYSVTVTDANGCSATASATVNNVGGPSVSITSTTNVLCFGQSTGSINITVSGGVAPYSYLWSNGATTEDISGLVAGTYSVTVTDANGCSTTASATITQPSAALSASAVATNATCGNANGSVDLTVTGGTAPYSYLWSNGATTEDISGLVAGTYSVTVTDANGCTATAGATVNNVAGPSATAVATSATCGNANGSVDLTVTGGTSPYSYLWSNGATTEDISGLTAGTYSVTVTDANGCTATAGATVNNIAGPSATAVATNATCGNANGSVDLTVTGGTSPYSYLWSNGSTTEDISGLVAGTYSVTVTDANGCTATASATVNNVGGPSVSITSTTNVLCFGQGTGSINITVSGGVAPYSYLWSNGATTEDISGLAAGTYSVTVTDANGCSTTASATITQPASALTASAVGVGLTCSTTGNNGTITLTVSGGTSPYTYLWSNGATTQNLASLAAGTYTVTVTDANGCTATASATIRARFAATSSVGTLACNDITGQVTVTPTGGTAPYTATATTSGVTPSSQSGSGAMVFTVAFGAYSFNVVDATGCLRVVTGRVAGPLVAAASAGTIPCGQTTTIVTVSASQGIPPYSGTGNFSVPAGPYSFTVTDSRGCTATVSGTIAAPLCYTVAEVYYPKYVQGVGTGSPSADTKVPYATRMTIGGLTAGATYRYFSRFVDNPSSALSNGIGDFILVNQVGNFSRVTSASMSTAGEYGEFTANGSGSYTGWFVQEPGSDIGFTPGNQLYWRIMLNDGAGGNTVAARVTAANPVTVLNFGSAPSDGTGLRRTTNVDYTAKNFVMLYNNVAGTGRPEAGTFIESDGTDNTVANGYADFYANSVNGVDKTWGTIIPNNLSNGINNISQYSLVDGSFVNACTSPDGVFGGTTDTKNASGGLTELVIDACNAPCNIALTFTQTNVSCFGGSTGSATVTAANTTGAVSYLWSNGQTTATATGLIAGTYTVTVTDANECSATGSVTITQPDAVVASAVATNATCGNANGSVNLTVTGGTAPYSYLWSNGATTEDISGLVAGTYSVTVTDANGCTATAGATVNNVAGPSATAVATSATCGNANGSVDLTVTGGTSPYSYLWSNGATTEDISGLTAGTYSVTVTDANGCTATAGATVNNIAGPSATAVATNATCGNANGSVDLTVTGGTSPYSYLWSNGSTTEDISGLVAGTYSVTVTDANGCTATASATVNNVGGPSVSITSTTNVLCFGQGTGSINITVSGGVAPYSYLWSNGATTEDISGLAAGTYSVTVTDANGCSTTASATITQPASALTASAVGVGLTCSTTGNNGTITLTVSGGTSPYTYLWSNGATTQNLASLAAGTYTVTVTDANGCTATASATIRARFAATSSVGTLACNDITGQVTVTPTGGTAPYTATATTSGVTPSSQSGSGAMVFTVAFGAYSFNVVDATGCLRVVTGRVAGPLVAAASAGTIPCGQTTTIVTVSASQGIPPYSGTGNFSVPAGPYSFTVTDSRGCTATVSGTIAAPLCYTVAEVYYPKYVQGVGTGSPSADTKVPYATRMTIGGLTAGATYRYFSRFVDNPSSALSNGIGDFILVNQVGNFSRVTSASMSTAGEYGEFTANGSGSYTGWFVQEPGSDIGFTPGNQLYWRIMLNDGAGGNTVAARVTAANPVTVLNFGSAPSDGTGLRRTTNVDYTAKNFVMLYNNVAGTGRPEAGTFIESDGTDNTVANGYADFYANSVNGVDKTWGTIIPNNLSNGINNISQYSLVDGSFVNACTSPDGVFGGTTDTKNASGGLTELVIDACNAPCNIALTFTQTNVSCFGGSTGSATVTAANTTGAVSYLWSNGQTTATATGLSAGTYSVTVMDANECSATGSVTITQPAAALVASSSATAIACNGGSSTVTVSATGGTAPYTGTGTFTRTAGTYSFTVTDANGCTSVTTITIAQPAVLVASSTATTIECNGGSSTVTVSATGGTAPYTGTGTFTRTAGTYSFTVTDANGCTSVTTITVAQPALLVASSSATAIACNGGSSTVTVSATGGTAPYTGTGTFTRTAGTYSFTVTDANGCTSITTITIAQPAVLVASSTATTIACNGGSSTVTVSATGGTAPYTGTGTFTRTAGTYSFTVTDANGCTSVTTITIAQPGAALVASSTATVIACNGGSSTVTVSATGGTAPFTGTGTFSRTAGTYSFTVTDANGCTAVTTITIAQPAALTVTTTTTPATVGSNGTATANPVGGTAPYTYLWNPGGQTTQTATGLAAGTYTVTVTDSRGCTTTATATVASDGCILAVNAGTDKLLCNNSSTVTLTASVTGVSAGTPSATPFTEVSGSTSDMRLFSGNIDHITIGNTFSQSENRNNCGKITETSKTLTIPSGAVVKKAYLYWSGSGSLDNTVKLQVPGSGSFTNLTADGTKTATRSGGFSYFAARKDITGFVSASGTYTVKDLNWNNGSPYCYDNSAYGAWAMTVIYEKSTLPSARIHVNTEKFVFTYPANTYSTTINNVSVPASCEADARLTIVAFEGDSYKGERFRMNGVLDADTNNFRGQAGPNLDIITKNAPSIVGGTTTLTYSIESYQSNTIFGQAIEGLFDYVKVLKYNTCPAPVCDIAYQWTKNGTSVGTTQSISVNTTGTYVVTATDCANCVARDTVVVTASTLSATSSAGTLTCNNSTTTVTVSATGGTAPYAGIGTFTRGAGTWNFTVTDAAGCSRVTTVTIVAPNCGPVDPNKCYKIVNRKSGKSMSIESCSTGDNKKAEQQTNSSCLVWKFVEVQPGFYRIINVNSNKSVEVKDASTSNDKEIVQAPYAGADHEKWSITANGAYFVIKAKHSGKAMSVKDGSSSNGAEIVQRGTGSNTEEQWSFVEVGCPALPFAPPAGGCDVTVYPNPTADYFNLIIKTTDKTTPVSVRILDVNGVVKAVYSNVQVTKTGVLRVGDLKWPGGTYFAEVTQGTERSTVKMIKLN